jgi:hypothetical protein
MEDFIIMTKAELIKTLKGKNRGGPHCSDRK